MTEPQSSTLSPPLDDVLNLYFHRLESGMNCTGDIIAVGKNLVRNLKQDNNSDETIFHELSVLFPQNGCPLTLYTTKDRDYMTAHRSQNALLREANDVLCSANSEFANKRRCIETERAARLLQTLSSTLTSPPATNNSFIQRQTQQSAAIKPGQYVSIEQDLSAGSYSHGGEAWVKAVHGTGGNILCDVEYVESTAGNITRTEKAVPLYRLTVKSCPWHEVQLQNHLNESTRRQSTRQHQQLTTLLTTPPPAATKPDKPLKSILSVACQSGMSKGWRAREMGFLTSAGKQRNKFRECFRMDLAELNGFLSAVPKARMHREHDSKDGKWKVRRQKYNPFTVKYLQYSWGVGIHYASNLSKMRTTSTAPNNTRDAILMSGKKAAKSAISNRKAAKAWYTPRRLFMQDRVTRKESQAETLAYESTKAVRYTWTEEAKAEWVLLSPAEKEVWNFHARNHDERQPFIRDQIIEAIRKNPTRSFQKIAADIDNWCSATAIHQWLSSHTSYSVYVERILPLLSKVQMQKHVDFAKLVREYWGQDTVGKKYLWIHFDEKWFFGWLCRANAKKCEQLGLEKNHAFIYHRNHVDKTMVIAVTGFAFKESMENGGHGVKIMMHRVQGARLAKKRVREGRKTQGGQQVYDGIVLREKGDVYMVDCNVTGSDAGTSDKPKFSLRDFFEHSLFPRVAEIVGHNGEYEGYIPVIQGDNAGPHQDRSLIQFCKQHCESMGWLWRPQAPQMPHMNNLDLAVFPAMSRRHAELLRSLNGNRMANPEKVWAAAKEVWDDLPSATIARGFILAFRIAEKVVKNKGSNNFLQGKDGSLHSDVRRDFYDTTKGVAKKAVVV